jgi:processed acidic surface protein
MKRSVLLFTCVSFLLVSIVISEHVVAAQVNEVELQQYLVNNNWSKEELIDYLQFYDFTLADFDSLVELQDFLGTSITTENLNDLLGKYRLDHSDLEILLAEYGETIDDYKFIEDLDLDIEFFLAYNDKFSTVNDFVSLFGITEAEIQNLFNHTSELDEERTWEKLNNIYATLEALKYVRDKDDLSEAEQEQFLSLWIEMFEALDIDARFFLVKEEAMTPVELKNIISEETLNGSLLQMSLHKLAGEHLATLVFSAEMLDSDLMYEALEQIGEVVKLSGEYRQMLEIAKLPKTAGNFVVNILVSIFLIISGFAMLVTVQRRTTA